MACCCPSACMLVGAGACHQQCVVNSAAPICSLVCPTARDTDAAVFNALKDSTFMERWITGQLGSVARPPTLALMLNM